MYQTCIPLDIIWMDSNHRIVDADEYAQPCKTQASKCPKYGGKQISAFVLEIGAGMARRFGLQLGQSDPVVMPWDMAPVTLKLTWIPINCVGCWSKCTRAQWM